jgi:hypothetical protein
MEPAMKTQVELFSKNPRRDSCALPIARSPSMIFQVVPASLLSPTQKATFAQSAWKSMSKWL